MSNSFFRK